MTKKKKVLITIGAILLVATPIMIGVPIIIATSHSDKQDVKNAKENFVKLTADQKTVDLTNEDNQKLPSKIAPRIKSIKTLNDLIKGVIVEPNGVRYTPKVVSYKDETKGEMVVEIEIKKGLDTDKFKFTITGFITKAESQADKINVENALAKIKDSTISGDIFKLPSAIKLASIKDLSGFPPTTIDDVHFSATLKSHNDEDGTIIITLIATKRSAREEKAIIISNFKKEIKVSGITTSTLNDEASELKKENFHFDKKPLDFEKTASSHINPEKISGSGLSEGTTLIVSRGSSSEDKLTITYKLKNGSIISDEQTITIFGFKKETVVLLNVQAKTLVAGNFQYNNLEFDKTKVALDYSEHGSVSLTTELDLKGATFATSKIEVKATEIVITFTLIKSGNSSDEQTITISGFKEVIIKTVTATLVDDFVSVETRTSNTPKAADLTATDQRESLINNELITYAIVSATQDSSDVKIKFEINGSILRLKANQTLGFGNIEFVVSAELSSGSPVNSEPFTLFVPASNPLVKTIIATPVDDFVSVETRTSNTPKAADLTATDQRENSINNKLITYAIVSATQDSSDVKIKFEINGSILRLKANQTLGFGNIEFVVSAELSSGSPVNSEPFTLLVPASNPLVKTIIATPVDDFVSVETRTSNTPKAADLTATDQRENSINNKLITYAIVSATQDSSDVKIKFEINGSILRLKANQTLGFGNIEFVVSAELSSGSPVNSEPFTLFVPASNPLVKTIIATPVDDFVSVETRTSNTPKAADLTATDQRENSINNKLITYAIVSATQDSSDVKIKFEINGSILRLKANQTLGFGNIEFVVSAELSSGSPVNSEPFTLFVPASNPLVKTIIATPVDDFVSVETRTSNTPKAADLTATDQRENSINNKLITYAIVSATQDSSDVKIKFEINGSILRLKANQTLGFGNIEFVVSAELSSGSPVNSEPFTLFVPASNPLVKTIIATPVDDFVSVETRTSNTPKAADLTATDQRENSINNKLITYAIVSATQDSSDVKIKFEINGSILRLKANQTLGFGNIEFVVSAELSSGSPVNSEPFTLFVPASNPLVKTIIATLVDDFVSVETGTSNTPKAADLTATDQRENSINNKLITYAIVSATQDSSDVKIKFEINGSILRLKANQTLGFGNIEFVVSAELSSGSPVNSEPFTLFVPASNPLVKTIIATPVDDFVSVETRTSNTPKAADLTATDQRESLINNELITYAIVSATQDSSDVKIKFEINGSILRLKANQTLGFGNIEFVVSAELSSGSPVNSEPFTLFVPASNPLVKTIIATPVDDFVSVETRTSNTPKAADLTATDQRENSINNKLITYAIVSATQDSSDVKIKFEINGSILRLKANQTLGFGNIEFVVSAELSSGSPVNSEPFTLLVPASNPLVKTIIATLVDDFVSVETGTSNTPKAADLTATDQRENSINNKLITYAIVSATQDSSDVKIKFEINGSILRLKANQTLGFGNIEFVVSAELSSGSPVNSEPFTLFVPASNPLVKTIIATPVDDFVSVETGTSNTPKAADLTATDQRENSINNKLITYAIVSATQDSSDVKIKFEINGSILRLKANQTLGFGNIEFVVSAELSSGSPVNSEPFTLFVPASNPLVKTIIATPVDDFVSVETRTSNTPKAADLTATDQRESLINNELITYAIVSATQDSSDVKIKFEINGSILRLKANQTLGFGNIEFVVSAELSSGSPVNSEPFTLFVPASNPLVKTIIATPVDDFVSVETGTSNTPKAADLTATDQRENSINNKLITYAIVSATQDSSDVKIKFEINGSILRLKANQTLGFGNIEFVVSAELSSGSPVNSEPFTLFVPASNPLVKTIIATPVDDFVSVETGTSNTPKAADLTATDQRENSINNKLITYAIVSATQDSSDVKIKFEINGSILRLKANQTLGFGNIEFVVSAELSSGSPVNSEPFTLLVPASNPLVKTIIATPVDDFVSVETRTSNTPKAADLTATDQRENSINNKLITYAIVSATQDSSDVKIKFEINGSILRLKANQTLGFGNIEFVVSAELSSGSPVNSEPFTLFVPASNPLVKTIIATPVDDFVSVETRTSNTPKAADLTATDQRENSINNKLITYAIVSATQDSSDVKIKFEINGSILRLKANQTLGFGNIEFVVSAELSSGSPVNSEPFTLFVPASNPLVKTIIATPVDDFVSVETRTSNTPKAADLTATDQRENSINNKLITYAIVSATQDSSDVKIKFEINGSILRLKANQTLGFGNIEFVVSAELSSGSPVNSEPFTLFVPASNPLVKTIIATPVDDFVSVETRTSNTPKAADLTATDQRENSINNKLITYAIVSATQDSSDVKIKFEINGSILRLKANQTLGFGNIEFVVSAELSSGSPVNSEPFTLLVPASNPLVKTIIATPVDDFVSVETRTSNTPKAADLTATDQRENSINNKLITYAIVSATQDSSDVKIKFEINGSILRLKANQTLGFGNIEFVVSAELSSGSPVNSEPFTLFVPASNPLVKTIIATPVDDFVSVETRTSNTPKAADLTATDQRESLINNELITYAIVSATQDSSDVKIKFEINGSILRLKANQTLGFGNIEFVVSAELSSGSPVNSEPFTLFVPASNPLVKTIIATPVDDFVSVETGTSNTPKAADLTATDQRENSINNKLITYAIVSATQDSSDVKIKFEINGSILRLKANQTLGFGNIEFVVSAELSSGSPVNSEPFTLFVPASNPLVKTIIATPVDDFVSVETRTSNTPKAADLTATDQRENSINNKLITYAIVSATQDSSDVKIKFEINGSILRLKANQTLGFGNIEFVVSAELSSGSPVNSEPFTLFVPASNPLVKTIIATPVDDFVSVETRTSNTPKAADLTATDQRESLINNELITYAIVSATQDSSDVKIKFEINGSILRLKANQTLGFGNIEFVVSAELSSGSPVNSEPFTLLVPASNPLVKTLTWTPISWISSIKKATTSPLTLASFITKDQRNNEINSNKLIYVIDWSSGPNNKSSFEIVDSKLILKSGKILEKGNMIFRVGVKLKSDETYFISSKTLNITVDPSIGDVIGQSLKGIVSTEKKDSAIKLADLITKDHEKDDINSELLRYEIVNLNFNGRWTSVSNFEIVGSVLKWKSGKKLVKGLFIFRVSAQLKKGGPIVISNLFELFVKPYTLISKRIVMMTNTPKTTEIKEIKNTRTKILDFITIDQKGNKITSEIEYELVFLYWENSNAYAMDFEIDGSKVWLKSGKKLRRGRYSIQLKATVKDGESFTSISNFSVI